MEEETTFNRSFSTATPVIVNNRGTWLLIRRKVLAMERIIVCTALLLALILPARVSAQDGSTLDGFSVTLGRVGCLGMCPDYEVSILGNGKVRYQGHAYVRVKGIRESSIPMVDVQKLVERLENEHFFQWDGKGDLCVDYPQVQGGWRAANRPGTQAGRSIFFRKAA